VIIPAFDFLFLVEKKQKCQPLLEQGVISRAFRQGRTLHWHSSVVGEEDKWSSSQLPCIRWDVHLHLALNKICGTTTEKSAPGDSVQRGKKLYISGRGRNDAVQCDIQTLSEVVSYQIAISSEKTHEVARCKEPLYLFCLIPLKLYRKWVHYFYKEYDGHLFLLRWSNCSDLTSVLEDIYTWSIKTDCTIQSEQMQNSNSTI